MKRATIPTDKVLMTLRVRVKDNKSKVLRQKAFEVNQVWNNVNDYCTPEPVPGFGWLPTPTIGEIQKELKVIKKRRGLSISASTIQDVHEHHEKARRQFKKSKLRWRVSGGARKALGWVPFSTNDVSFQNGQIYFNKHHFKVWDSYGLGNFKFRAGSFSEDSRGRWYLNIVVLVDKKTSTGKGHVGIDLGLKTTATCSDGTTLARKEYYRRQEKSLATAQRANKAKRVKAIHTKIKNQRKDTNHKFSTKLVRNNELIVVGDISSSKLAKTNMAKSVLDAGWYQLKNMLDYKSKGMQVIFREVNESYTTQICSGCGDLPDSRPKGIADLEIREWTCSGCGTLHDRDINAAKNILRLGSQALAGGVLETKEEAIGNNGTNPLPNL